MHQQDQIHLGDFFEFGQNEFSNLYPSGGSVSFDEIIYPDRLQPLDPFYSSPLTVSPDDVFKDPLKEPTKSLNKKDLLSAVGGGTPTGKNEVTNSPLYIASNSGKCEGYAATKFQRGYRSGSECSLSPQASRRGSIAIDIGGSSLTTSSGSFGSPATECSRREAHMASEQRRRAIMKKSFDKLQELLPTNEYRRPNKANLLQAAVSYIIKLRQIENSLRMQNAHLSHQYAILAQQLGVTLTTPQLVKEPEGNLAMALKLPSGDAMLRKG